jgi:FkbM family methyltransferase
MMTLKDMLLRPIPTPIYRACKRHLDRVRLLRAPRIRSFPIQSPEVLKCAIGYNVYGAYCVPLSSRDRPAAQAIFKGEIWELETIRLMAARCLGRDIVHGGAFFGDFLPALSKAVGVAGLVWACEPNPENFRCAAITQALNNLSNVRLHHAAFGAEAGQGRILMTDSTGKSLGGSSHLAGIPGSGKEGSSVDILPIDAIVPPDRRVGIVQLDVEGFELEALKGAISTVRRCLPLLILEKLPSDPWIAENILALGYQVRLRVHENTVLSALA